MIWGEREREKSGHLPLCLFTREDEGRSGVSDEFRGGRSAFRTSSRGCRPGCVFTSARSRRRVLWRVEAVGGAAAGGRSYRRAQVQEGAATGRVTFLQGNSSGCYVSVTALAYRAQSVTNEIRQRRPIFFLIFFSPPFRPRSCENFMILNYPYFFFYDWY